MADYLNFYIDGAWVPPAKPATRDVINPATEQSIGKISMGSAEDVDRAVKAARKAFETYSRTTREERIALLEKIISVFKAKQDELATTIASEVGAPIWLSKAAQAAAGIGHFAQALAVLKTFEFEEPRGRTMIVREPVGVVGMITPWNWPINQIACKVAPALAAGCTIVLKPTEIAPLNAIIFTQILDEAGVPAGVFNLVNGDGPTVGAAIAVASGHRHGVVHRLDARRRPGRDQRGADGEARDAGARRQVGEHHPRRCGSADARWRAASAAAS